MEIADRSGEVAGLDVHWLEAGARPVLYLHGVPTASWEWLSFLERTGGVAPDLPGFGRSAKPADFDYSIAGYDAILERFCEHVGLERLSLVVHDWGGVGLALAQRFPERIARLVLFSTVPLLPGYRWHRVARAWRRRAARRPALPRARALVHARPLHSAGVRAPIRRGAGRRRDAGGGRRRALAVAQAARAGRPSGGVSRIACPACCEPRSPPLRRRHIGGTRGHRPPRPGPPRRSSPSRAGDASTGGAGPPR